MVRVQGGTPEDRVRVLAHSEGVEWLGRNWAETTFTGAADGRTFGDEADFFSGVVTELQRRLPYGNIKTCGAFRQLKAGCRNSRHTEYPHSKMKLIDLPDGATGWVCCRGAKFGYRADASDLDF
jgi:hypothetical protein